MEGTSVLGTVGTVGKCSVYYVGGADCFIIQAAKFAAYLKIVLGITAASVTGHCHCPPCNMSLRSPLGSFLSV